MYIKKTYDLGDVKEIARYYPGNYGAPGCKRKPKRKRTPEDIERQNWMNMVRRVQRIILANFKKGDWHVILTYRIDQRPESLEKAKKQRSKFIKDMRKAYRKAGYEFKCFGVTEVGKRGAVHHHMIIEDIRGGGINAKDLVMECWEYGSRHFTPMYEEGEFRDLAEYLLKGAGKEGQAHSYTRTRNLTIPQPRKEKVYRRKWDEDPKPEEGHYIIKDSLVNGINPVTGRPYQHYMMRRMPGKEGSADGGSKGVRGNLMEGAGKEGRRGRMAGRMNEARGAHHQAGVRPPGGRDAGAGNPDGARERAMHTEKAVQGPDIRGVWARAKRGAKRLAQAMAGKRLEERQGAGGKKRRSMGGPDGKSRPHTCTMESGRNEYRTVMQDAARRELEEWKRRKQNAGKR